MWAFGGRFLAKARKAQAAPGPEDFTAGAVYRAVLLDTIQHPATILPAAASGVAFLYMALFGLDVGGFAVAFASAIAAGAAWVFNYFVRGEDLARRHVEKLHKLRRELRLGEVESLVEEWRATGHADGLQQAEELSAAYRHLDEALRQRLAQDGAGPAFTLQRLRVLAEDTYREGVAILRQALVVHSTAEQVDRGKLERELDEWRRELQGMEDAGRQEALSTRIAAHEKRLELLDVQARKLDELLAKSETLEAALEATCLEIADLGNSETLFHRGSAADDLERAMNAARSAEERVRGAGAAAREDDDIYLKAGRGPESTTET